MVLPASKEEGSTGSVGGPVDPGGSASRGTGAPALLAAPELMGNGMARPLAAAGGEDAAAVALVGNGGEVVAGVKHLHHDAVDVAAELDLEGGVGRADGPDDAEQDALVVAMILEYGLDQRAEDLLAVLVGRRGRVPGRAQVAAEVDHRGEPLVVDADDVGDLHSGAAARAVELYVCGLQAGLQALGEFRCWSGRGR